MRWFRKENGFFSYAVRDGVVAASAKMRSYSVYCLGTERRRRMISSIGIKKNDFRCEEALS